MFTFDYRYFGRSFPLPYNPDSFTGETRHIALRSAPPNIDLSETWARLDFSAVVRHAAEQWSGIPLCVVGHCLSGRQ